MAKLLCFILTAFSFAAHARLIQPDDETYYRLRRDGTLYIYSSGSREFIGALEAYGRTFRPAYEGLFGWKLDEEADYILLSPRNQIANAFATNFPNLKTIWSPAGAGLLETMALSSWALTLQAHESAHLYQMNPKGRIGRGLKYVFGNPLFLLPFWPVVPAPNFLLPTSMLEGNAVLNESRLNFGGRLHSGERRALMLASIAADEIDATRLINDEFKFPFGEGAYLFGGYFQAHLAGKYGVEKTNQFYGPQAVHILNPLLLNETFRRHFGASFYQEVHEFVHGLKPLARKQRSSSGEVLGEATFVGPLNHDDTRIWWLSTNGMEPPRLNVFEKATRKLTVRTLDIPSGKIFWDGDRPLSATSQQHDLHHEEYSLYGEGAHLDPRFRGEIVTDMRGGHRVSLSATESWLEGRVLRDGETFDVGHSNPILDESGRVLYFRQNGFERLLYRDRTPIARFDGFYGKLTEALGAGDVFFIGNSDYGSSLFRWNGQEIERVSDSDRVTDARRVSDDEFLLVEVGAQGSRVVSSRVYRRAERPAVYSYAYSTQNIMPGPAVDVDEIAGAEKPYSALREMRYSALDLRTFWSNHDGWTAATAASFNDPLQYQSFSAGAATSEFTANGAFAEYSYSGYLPDMFIRYAYSEDLYTDFAGNNLRTHDHEGQVGARIPVLRHDRWDAEISTAGAFRDKEQDRLLGAVDRTHINTYGLLSRGWIHFEVPTALGLFPWREFAAEVRNNTRVDTFNGRKDEDTSFVSARYRHGFANQIYLSIAASGAWAQANDLPVESRPLAMDSDIRMERLLSRDTINVRHAASARVQLQKVYTIPAYSARIPVGINRLAPYLIAQKMVMDNDPLDRYPSDLFEYGWGLDAEVLLLHKFPLYTGIAAAINSRDKESDTNVHFGFKREF